jgi:16S rRNA (cytosine1402-N4)-methyltransferase
MTLSTTGSYPTMGRARDSRNASGSEVAAPSAEHVPVLLQEAVQALNLQPGSVVVDGTFGGGGHARAILERIAPCGRLLAFDRDAGAWQRAHLLEAEFPGMLTFVHASYATLGSQLSALDVSDVDGVLLDLGLSSLQLAEAERGFAFSVDGPLDMRFDRSSGETAAQLLARLEANELAQVLWTYGEERQGRRIANAIVRARAQQPIETTAQLRALVEPVVGGRRGAQTHPATRTFQALRIAVNDELGELERGMAAGVQALRPGGRFVVVAFHSLEDRIVKRFFAQGARGCICPPELPICVCGHSPTVTLFGGTVRPTPSEIAANPRARSAIMRVAERLP